MADLRVHTAHAAPLHSIRASLCTHTCVPQQQSRQQRPIAPCEHLDVARRCNAARRWNCPRAHAWLKGFLSACECAQTFAEQMATEYDWRNLDADYDEAEDASDGESDSDEDSRPDASSGAGVRQQPQAAESPRHESQATGSGQSSEAASGAPPGVPGSAVPQGSRGGVEAPTEEAVVDPLALTAPSWMKRNADIYGAQVRSPLCTPRRTCQMREGAEMLQPFGPTCLTIAACPGSRPFPGMS